MSTQKATFGAGCFWGVEVTFRNVPGVTEAIVGYMGGHQETPTYKEVCAGDTGHAEVVQVEYDPEKVTFAQLLQVFFENHDPSQVDRQGPDVGSQYRSAVFFHTSQQAEEARALIRDLDASERYADPVATQVEAAGPFWKAEEYHQRYLEKRGLAQCRTS